MEEVKLYSLTEKQIEVVDAATRKINQTEAVLEALRTQLDYVLSMVAPEGATRFNFTEHAFYGPGPGSPPLALYEVAEEKE